MKQRQYWSADNISAGEAAGSAGDLMSASMKGDGILLNGRFEERQQLFNAKQADRAAEEALSIGERQVDNIRRKTKQLVGEQRAAFAANGVDINDGSAAEIQEDSHYWGAMDELTTRNNAILESYGYKQQALQLRTQAEVTRISTDYKYRMTLVEGGINGAKDAAKAGAGGM